MFELGGTAEAEAMVEEATGETAVLMTSHAKTGDKSKTILDQQAEQDRSGSVSATPGQSSDRIVAR